MAGKTEKGVIVALSINLMSPKKSPNKINFCNQLVTHIFVTDWLLKKKIMRRDVFQAIADPTRREIINLLANKRMHLNAIADKFTISRPAISKHIKILTECGLVQIKIEGREHYCEAKLKKLKQVSDWSARFKDFWENKLDALENHLLNNK